MEKAAQCPAKPSEEDAEIAILRSRYRRARKQLAGQIGDQPDDTRLRTADADRKLRIAIEAFAHRGNRQGGIDSKDVVQRLVLEIGEAGLFRRMRDFQDKFALAIGADVKIVVALPGQGLSGSGKAVVLAQDGKRIGNRDIGRVLGQRLAECIGHGAGHGLASGSTGSSPHQSAMNSAIVWVTLRTESRSTASS